MPDFETILETIRVLAEIGTAFGTIALAFVTYKTLKQMQRENRPDIGIVAESGMGAKFRDLSDENMTAGFMDYVPTICFKALNKGKRTVSFERFELWLENVVQIRVPFLTFRYNPDQEEMSVDRISFPYDLLPDKNYVVNIYQEDIARFLFKKGYTGKVKLMGHFRDQIGIDYSGSYDSFDIEKAR